ncbi:SDR family oxidoreductase [Microlunatus elymi]|uniref:SDR family oxidoreductase n=1 Tax=Microlunatus elymi TaxID=2596828 RepID=A0A516Q3I8_9ACTN|nr:oxidoreductase [Microlunatus elymi]QDP97994.1 SDR family oxidoreductase [Microlunatus elymi]
MKLGLDGKLAVVTGASKGIGLAITRALVDEGVQVMAGARAVSPDLAWLQSAGGVEFVSVDLATTFGAQTLVDRAVERGGRVDIVVNNVGAVTPRPGGFNSVTDEDWVATLNLTLLAAVRTVRAALPHMSAGGSIISISSVNASLPDPLVIDYSAAKAALTNFSKSLSKEVGPAGIRVNTIGPGPVETDLWLGEHGVAQTVGQEAGRSPAQVAADAAAESVTGRFSRPQEVADLVLLLASDRTANVTGANFAVDGGMIPTL